MVLNTRNDSRTATLGQANAKPSVRFLFSKSDGRHVYFTRIDISGTLISGGTHKLANVKATTDEEIAKVGETGVITAVSKGKRKVCAVTTTGARKVISVTVKKVGKW